MKRTELYGRDKDMPRPLGSAFIQCNLQLGAHVLAQCVSYHKVHLVVSCRTFETDNCILRRQPLAMYDKYVEVSPKDVIWDNIDVRYSLVHCANSADSDDL